jgi:hypothetical protein
VDRLAIISLSKTFWNQEMLVEIESLGLESADAYSFTVLWEE